MSYTCFRIFNENYVEEDMLANYSVSSENSDFPAENFFNFQRRSKVFRTEGYFNVTSSNNTIIFKEGAAIALTATITVGEYTSISSFLTAVKTALDAAGVSTYTVTQDSLRTKITSNGVGGDGRFELILTNGSFTAYDLLGFDNSTDRTSALTYTADYIRIHTNEYIQFDLGISTNPDAFLLIGAKNKAMQISPTATIKLQANHTNNFNSPPFSVDIDYDDEVLAVLDDAGIGDDSYRYWQFSVIDETNPAGYIEVGAIFLGNYWNPQRTPQFPLRTSNIDRTVTVFSESGQSFSDLKEKTKVHSIRYIGLTKANIEEFWNIWEKYGTGKPFFISMDTSEAFSTDYRRRIVFVKIDDEPSENLISANNFELTFTVREEL